MTVETKPHPGQVYDLGGKPALYIRTEQRPGAEQSEHLFVLARRRVVFQQWTAEVPPEATLLIDTEGRSLANEFEWLLWAADHERQILLGLLKQACAWLPRERADELRDQYRQTRPEQEGQR